LSRRGSGFSSRGEVRASTITLRGERFHNTNALARITKAALVRLLRGELQVSAAEHDRIFNSASEK
jgi:hypothetical protein